MHELPITEGILKIATEAAEGRRITTIHLLVGELSSIVDDSVQFYFDILSKGTTAEGAVLDFQRRPATLTCSDCGQSFQVRAPLPAACPHCGGTKLQVTGGRSCGSILEVNDHGGISVQKRILSANDGWRRTTEPHLKHIRSWPSTSWLRRGQARPAYFARQIDCPEGYALPWLRAIRSSIDTGQVLAAGIPAVQINTGGNCHLDAPMIRRALPGLPLDRIDVLFIENVGNLVCPAEFDLGAALAVVVASVPEGHDKPYKYPGMFAAGDAVLLNKADLAAYFDFDLDYFRRGVAMVNSDAPVFVVSCRTGAGLDEWIAWLVRRQIR
jgi:hydrogenase nickel incorporation protein HypB